MDDPKCPATTPAADAPSWWQHDPHNLKAKAMVRHLNEKLEMLAQRLGVNNDPSGTESTAGATKEEETDGDD